MHRLLLVLLLLPACDSIHFHPSVEMDPAAQSYPAENDRRIREDQERLDDGRPLKHHADEDALRRRMYERDFYERYYESARDSRGTPPPAPEPARHEPDAPGDGFGGW